MRLIGGFEISRIKLDFDCNNFIVAKIVHSSSWVKKIFIILLDLIVIVSEWEMSVI